MKKPKRWTMNKGAAMADTPMLEQDTPVRRLELEAIQLYREKYPEGLPWRELADTTRYMWVAYAETQGGGK